MGWGKKKEFLFWCFVAAVIAAYAIVLHSIMSR